MTESDAAHTTEERVIEVMSNPDRQDIRDLLLASAQPLSEGEIRQQLEVPDLRHHLKMLEGIGMAAKDTEGKWRALTRRTDWRARAGQDAPLPLRLANMYAVERRVRRMRGWEAASAESPEWADWDEAGLGSDCTVALTLDELAELSELMMEAVRGFRDKVGRDRERPADAETVFVVMSAFPLRPAISHRQ